MTEIIVALDTPTADDALALVGRLPDLRWVKVGSTMHVASGPDFVHRLKDRGLRVFLDLKWHDIPHQVASAVAQAGRLGVDLATVHSSGGRPMLECAVAAAGAMRLAAVSVLTSHSPATYGEAIGRDDVDLPAEVERLVRLSVDCGVGAIVCSADEVGRLADGVGEDVWRVVPGIRLPESRPDDQARVADPATAVARGATHLVVGRPIWRAEHPEAVYEQLCKIVS